MSEPLRILVVEDEALILMQIETTLEAVGHHVVGTAMTAAEAIAQIETCRPELVLIDLRLADGSSGLLVAQAIRDRDGIAAAFMTANVRQLPEEMAGATAVIAKPFSEAVLAESMAYLEACLRSPPPTGPLPTGMQLAPDAAQRFAAMRG